MKIKMLTISAGPDGVIRPGDVIDVEKKEGKALIGGGYGAEILEDPAENESLKKKEG